MSCTRSSILALASLITPVAMLRAQTVSYSPNQNNANSYDTAGANLNLQTAGNSSYHSTQSGVIYGSGRVTKQAQGALHLTALNTYTGGTTIAGGHLYLDGVSATGTGTIRGNVSLNGAATELHLSTVNALGYETGQKVDRITVNLANVFTTAPGDQGWGINYTLTGDCVLSSNNGHHDPAASNPAAASRFSFGGPAGGNTSMMVSGGQPGSISRLYGRVDLRADNGNPAVLFDVGGLDSPTQGAKLEGWASFTGDAGLTKIGIGTLNLNAINTYTGTTTVNQGVINVNSAGANGIGGIRSPLVINGGTVNLNAANSLGYAPGEKVDAITVNNGLLATTAPADQGWGIAYTLNGGEIRSNGGIPDPNNPNKFAFGNFTTVTVGAGTSPRISGGVTLRNDINPDTDITVGANGNLRLDAVLTGGGGIKKYGPGTLTLTASNSYTGTTTVSEGTLVANGSSLPGNVVNNSAVVFQSGGTCPGVISGSGTLQKTGAGTVVLSGANAYAGGTTLSGGFISMASDTHLGAANTSLTFAGGGLTTTADYTLSRPIVANGAVYLSPTAGTLTLGSVIASSAGVEKTGAGTLAINSIQTYGGVTSVHAGRLVLGGGSGGTGAIRGALTVYYGATAEISSAAALGQTTGEKVTSVHLSGGNLVNSSSGGIGVGVPIVISGTHQTSTITGHLDLRPGSSFDVAPNATLNVSGPLGSGSGTPGLLKKGLGTMVLAGQNTYAGSTIVENGTLQVVNPQGTHYRAIRSGLTGGAYLEFRGNTAVNHPGGTAQSFYANNFGFINFAESASAGSASYEADSNAGINFNNSATAASGSFQIGSGSNITFYDTSSAGSATITARSGSELGFIVGTTGSGAKVIAQAGSTVRIVGAGSVGIGSLSGDGILQLDTAAVSWGALGFEDVFSGIIQNSGSLVKVGSGTLTLSNSNSYTGGTTIRGGLIHFGTPANFGTGSIVINGGGLRWAEGNTLDISPRLGAFGSEGATFDTNGNPVSLAAVLSGSGGLTKTGAGVLDLTAVNTFSGGTVIRGGFIKISTPGSFGSGTITLDGGGLLWAEGNTADPSPLFLPIGAGGGILDTNGNSITLGAAIGGSGLITKAGAGDLTLNGGNSYTGGIHVLEGNLTGNSASLRSNIDLPTTLTFQQDFDDTFTGSISGTGKVVKSGTGTLAFVTPNTYAGGTTIAGGAIEIASAACLGSGGITFAGGGLRWSVGSTADPSARFNPFPALLTSFDTNGNDVTFASAVSGGGFEKKGEGTLTLAGHVTANLWATKGELAIAAGGQLENDQFEFIDSTARIEGGEVSTEYAYFGSGQPGSGVIESGSLNVGTDLHVGFFSPGGQLTLNGGTVTSNTAYIGSAGNGTLTISGGSFNNTGFFNIGWGGSGTLQMSGGTLQTGHVQIAATPGGISTVNLSGGTWTSDAGLNLSNATFNLTDSGALNLGSSDFFFNSSAVLNLGTGGTAGAFHARKIHGSGGVVTVNFNHSGSYTFATPFTGHLNITKLGSGITRLTGASEHYGATRVQAGTLLVDGSLAKPVADPAVTVDSSATLGGSGLIEGATTLQGGAHLSPGSEVGTLTFSGGLSLAAGTIIDLQIGAARDLVQGLRRRPLRPGFRDDHTQPGQHPRILQRDLHAHRRHRGGAFQSQRGLLHAWHHDPRLHLSPLADRKPDPAHRHRHGPLRGVEQRHRRSRAARPRVGSGRRWFHQPRGVPLRHLAGPFHRPAGGKRGNARRPAHPLAAADLGRDLSA
ncbi:beta strand repeat-containing protein [Luteolibacter sp. Populi]|uniref:beta strand repeat-containing protein n=1 Tax=Luteolibacter sp. Populi TaxID=3230487 RepID=UPI0034654D63